MVIIQAFKEDIFLGCSLHFIGNDTLYGRYWGALQEVPFLHFELCYYQAIEFAIQNKLRKVEAGAQGEHKISRGYIPELTYSNHWFESKELKESINIFFYEEGKKVKETIEYLKKLSPFKS
jgi:predicted N-acyltransferase